MVQRASNLHFVFFLSANLAYARESVRSFAVDLLWRSKRTGIRAHRYGRNDKQFPHELKSSFLLLCSFLRPSSFAIASVLLILSTPSMPSSIPLSVLPKPLFPLFPRLLRMASPLSLRCKWSRDSLASQCLNSALMTSLADSLIGTSGIA